MNSITVKVLRLPGNEDLPLPAYQSEGAAGMDLTAAVTAELIIAPGQIRMVPTGLRLSIPEGYEGQVRPRSGLALKHGIGVLNSPGTVDSDYRGEVGIILFNAGEDSFSVKRGDRIAQLVFVKHEKAQLIEVDYLDESERGEGGFGSTGG